MKCTIGVVWDMDQKGFTWEKGQPGTTKEEALACLDDTYVEARAALLATMTERDREASSVIVHVPASKVQRVIEVISE